MTNPKTYYEINEWDVMELKNVAGDIASWNVEGSEDQADQKFWIDYLSELADRIQHNLEKEDAGT